MTVEAGNTDKIISNIAECRDMGIEILPPDVNESLSGFTSVNDKIRFGLSAIKNIGESTIESIINVRKESGKFSTIFQFCKNMDSKKINKKSMESLVKSGAFDSINDNRGQLFESIELLLSFIALNTKLNTQNQSSLFPLEESISLPELINAGNWDEKEILRSELDVLGFFVTNHPMEKYSAELSRIIKIKDSETIKDTQDGKEASIAGVVRTLKVRNTKSGSGIFGNLILEDLKGSVEAVVFNDLLRKSLSILEDRTEPIILKGIVENTEDRTKLRATDISSLKELKSLSTLNILISEDKANNEFYSKLQKTFINFPGNSKINLKIETDQGRAVIEVGEYKVDIDDPLIEELESMLGKGTVSII